MPDPIRVDLHLHTSDRSPCAIASAREMVAAALDYGLATIALTDHDLLVPPSELDALNQEYAPLQVLGGVEVSIGDEHFVVLGARHVALESRRLAYAELHRIVRGEGGFLTLAHPFRFSRSVTVDVAKYPPDAIELRSLNTRAAKAHLIQALAKDTGAVLVSNSDAHDPEDVGAHHVVLEGSAADEQTLFSLLRSGRFKRAERQGAPPPDTLRSSTPVRSQ